MRRAKAELLRKIHGGQICQIVHCMARLKIADALKAGPLSLEALSEKCSVAKDPLRRLCAALVALHLLDAQDNSYWLTDEGKLLLSEDPTGLYAIACFKGDRLVWDALGRLCDGLKSGRSPFELAHGKELFEHLEQAPQQAETFHAAMESYERQSSDKILDLYDFSKMQSVVDVGGGSAGFLKRLLRRNPKLQATLLELPAVAHRVSPHDRLSVECGSFFDQVPVGADAYILRNILHDWDDERCHKILRNVKAAMRPDSRLLIFETVVDRSPDARLGRYSDLNMFVLTPGGKERDEAELLSLLETEGLACLQILRCTASKALITAEIA